MTSLYERVGGAPFFERLVDRFYDEVALDPRLRPMYREGDLSEERRWLALFLVQYWGGPGDYSAERGHPRLRMRHFAFSIGVEERDAWLRHMLGAVAASGAAPEDVAELEAYFVTAADFMMNR
ncbi:MAG TPA: globin [Acidimicrobiales bacterium]|nr:globin [Acidimicrobiales bacterium]